MAHQQQVCTLLNLSITSNLRVKTIGCGFVVPHYVGVQNDYLVLQMDSPWLNG